MSLAVSCGISCPHNAGYCLVSKAAQICAAFVVTAAAHGGKTFTRIVSNSASAWSVTNSSLRCRVGDCVQTSRLMNVSESISAPHREIKDIVSANDLSIEAAQNFWENARKCRRQR